MESCSSQSCGQSLPISYQPKVLSCYCWFAAAYAVKFYASEMVFSASATNRAGARAGLAAVSQACRKWHETILFGSSAVTASVDTVNYTLGGLEPAYATSGLVEQVHPLHLRPVFHSMLTNLPAVFCGGQQNAHSIRHNVHSPVCTDSILLLTGFCRLHRSCPAMQPPDEVLLRRCASADLLCRGVPENTSQHLPQLLQRVLSNDKSWAEYSDVLFLGSGRLAGSQCLRHICQPQLPICLSGKQLQLLLHL